MILIAENDPLLRTFYAEAYRQCPMEFALDGHDLITKARLLPYTLLWVDLVMPFVTGSQAVRTIRAESGPNQKTCIMAVTGVPEDEIDPDELIGFDWVHTKPVSNSTISSIFKWASEPGIPGKAPIFQTACQT